MKTYVTHDATSITGFALVVENDDGTTSTTPITTIIEDGRTLKLPKNPSGRQYLAVRQATLNEKVELIPREARTFTGATGTKSTRISFTEEDLAQLPSDTVEIIKQAYASLEVNREKAKLQALIAKYEAQAEALKAQLGL